MKEKPTVGQKVRLNNYGLEQCFGSSLGLAHMKTLELTIMAVDKDSMTAPELTWMVRVDNSGIDRLMIDNWCFDAA